MRTPLYLRPWFLLAATAAVATAGGSATVLDPHGIPIFAQTREPPARPLRRVCRELGIRYPPPSPRVIVRKGERCLTLHSGTTLLKEYRVGLGTTPVGHKPRQGDGRTPEGDYYICTRLERSRFHRFLGLSYPGVTDAQWGVQTRLITPAERKRILAAQRRKQQPPWNTRLGGAVGIHGSGSTSDWTAGCIAVEDPEIEELFAVLPLGTPVRIQP